MNRSIVGIVRTPAALTITAAILLSTQADAQRSGSTSQPPGSGGDIKVNLAPKNKLAFPFGVQKFERRENIKPGDPITVLPGWSIESAPGMVAATVEETPPADRG
jgi:hypothetical protein